MRGTTIGLLAAGPAFGALALGGVVVLAGSACTVEPRDENNFETHATTSPSTVDPSATTTVDVESTGDGLDSSTGTKLDAPAPTGGGCDAIDFLFVVDNSASMATYQLALTEAFPGFITAMFDALPSGIDVHVGMTTTDFDAGCDASESTQNCQSTATFDEVQAHYRRPDQDNDGGNGTQGRLFQWAGQSYFEIGSDDDPAPLSTWFSNAAVAAGEEGCSFEMPVAAAGFATHEANASANEGFLRDEGALLVIFFLTDEPDKSVESEEVYAQMILDAKAGCGGEVCVFTSGLVPTCIMGNNQKLWQFLTYFHEEEPRWGDIELTNDYSMVFGDALAGAIADACSNVPIP